MAGTGPYRYSKEKHEVIVAAITKGFSHEMAANYARIGYRTLTRWLAHARAYEDALVDEKEPNSNHECLWRLWLDIKRAEVDYLEIPLECIRVASHDPKTWQAAAWDLERRRPQDFGKRAAIQEEKGGSDKTIIVRHQIPGLEPKE